MQHPIYGRKLAVLTRRANNVVQVDTGVITFLHADVLLDRGPRKRPLRLRSDWMRRVESVEHDMTGRLGDAEVVLSLSAAELSEHELSTLL